MSDLAVRGIGGHHGHGGGRTEARGDADRAQIPGGVTAARGDQVSLSPDALARALAEVEDGDSGAVSERGQPLVRGRMRGLLHKALGGNTGQKIIRQVADEFTNTRSHSR